MKDPTQEEKDQAMENMECWKTQEHLKECRKCAPVGNWLQIEEEFRKKYGAFQICEKISKPEQEKILAFFKLYFQEQMHKEAVEELESIECQWENCSGGRYCEKHSLEKMDV